MWWGLKSPASRLLTQSFVQAQIKENTNAPRQYPLWGEFPSDRWIPRTKASYAEYVSIWWHHDERMITVDENKPYRHSNIMMTSSNGNIFSVTGHLCGELTGTRWIPHKRPVTRSFDVLFALRPNKRLSKQLWGWWFETQSRPLWRHRNMVHIKASHVQIFMCIYNLNEDIIYICFHITNIKWFL